MEQKTSEFDKVLGAWDILVIAFGAMIGWVRGCSWFFPLRLYTGR